MKNNLQKAVNFMKVGKYQLAKDIILHAAENGNCDAQERLGFIYMYGIGVEVNYETAKHWLVMSSDAGNSRAKFYLAKIFYDEKSYPLAFKFFSESAAKKFPPALYWLSVMFKSDNLGCYDKDRSIRCMRVGADLGHVYSLRDYFIYKINNTDSILYKIIYVFRLLKLYFLALYMVFNERKSSYIFNCGSSKILSLVDNELLLK